MTTIEKRVLSRSHRSFVVLGIAICLASPIGPAIAAEHDQDSHTLVERPVVVVRSSSHSPDFTWTVEGQRSFLGVQTVDLTPELRSHFGVPRETGVLISRIVEASPAAESDLLVGDIITTVDGEDITSPADLARAIGHRESGDVVDLEVWRDTRVRHVQSTLVEREGPWVDIRQIRLPEGPLHDLEVHRIDLEGAIELETETLNKAIERLNHEMESPEWQQRVHSFTEHQGSLMKRIELLEARLKELEQELQDLSEDP